MTFSVCVYCGSSDGIAQPYLDLAADVGVGIAERGWQLVSGGGRKSMMGAVAIAARKAGARTVGVIPRSMVEREWADHDSDELLVVETMRERKALMEAHADAFLALPGGIGTCEELFEAWTARSLGLHRKPVVVLDPDDHWSGLLDWVAGVVAKGFASQHSPLGSLRVARTVSEALDAVSPSAA